ncbi:uncharacterized protein LOC131637412 isoform X2 [Vicia villosa]|uniref:uncharacterized protein LOC131637412 isoform X2 n=1 Tax=Vicia villosa TaxID=3911 RepID=UPI00273C7EE4|nr:uncharacterized protein LOC131637412 isoform X2 [Vicia villosa]
MELNREKSLKNQWRVWKTGWKQFIMLASPVLLFQVLIEKMWLYSKSQRSFFRTLSWPLVLSRNFCCIPTRNFCCIIHRVKLFLRTRYKIRATLFMLLLQAMGDGICLLAHSHAQFALQLPVLLNHRQWKK